jgi:glycosyltransferase involved in cell wall biosynthesis
MLSWEYPPKIVGGIARHVEELSWALARKPGIEVHVVTCDFPGAPAEEVYKGVHIHRVSPYPADGGYRDFIQWVHHLNSAMWDRSHALIREWLASDSKVKAGTSDPKKLPNENGILLHAHDWLAYFAAVGLKRYFKLPLVATVHATEFGRNHGLHTDVNRYINEIEVQLATEAWRVIVCSYYMKGEIEFALGAPWDKIDVIYNGIDAEKFSFPFPPEEAAEFRSRFAAPDAKMILFVGRGVREKGAPVLIGAVPGIRDAVGNVKLVIAGGGSRQHLVDEAFFLGVGHDVHFTGFIPDNDLLRLYRVADVACFPSLYEPFGIVALEAMAARTPVVVTDTGGFPEVVQPDETGTVVWTDNSDSLVWGITRVLKNPDFACRMAIRAYERVRTTFNWDLIAENTVGVYNRIWFEYRKSGW